MTKRRRKTAVPSAAPPADGVPAIPRSTLEVDILAGAAALICVAIGFLSAQVLNPDGVSYLDLASAIERGDWTHFVQGYWSPLLPFITGVTGAICGLSGPALIPVTHALNLIVVLGGLLIVWWWARGLPSPWFGRFAIAAFMICSAGVPRIEAVTPDVLLLVITTWLSYELLVRGGERWLLLGALLGVAFLAKTSSWPWLLVTVPLRLWASRDPAARRRVWRSTVVCAAVMLIWIIPMSIKYGHPTLGSSGRLNYSWYIHANTSRLPDTDLGRNTAYQSVAVGGGRQVTVAAFDEATYWTYQPWGDPTAWQTKVLSETGHLPNPLQLTGYWARLTGLIFGLWLAPLLAAVLLPALLLFRRPGWRHELLTTGRDTLVVVLLGLVGLLQFAAVHAEPRLIAPYGAMLAFGVITWSGAGTALPAGFKSAAIRGALSWLGVLATLGFAVVRLAEGIKSYRRISGVATQLNALRDRLAAAGQPHLPLAIVGPAAPAVASAYWIGARVVLQVPPNYADLIATLPVQEQSQMLITLFSGKVPMIWQTTANGSIRMLVVPPPQR